MQQLTTQETMSEYQILEAYRRGSLEATWRSLKAELIAADHFNKHEELPFNTAQQERFGEIAAAIIAVLADEEIQRLANDIDDDPTSKREALYDFWQSPEYQLKRALQDLSSTRTMITDTYNVRDVIEA